MSRLFPPEVGTRWVHRDCKRVAIVVSTTGGAGPYAVAVEYRYEATAGVAPGRIRRLGSKGKGATPTQTMSLDDWSRLFTKRAPERRRGAS